MGFWAWLYAHQLVTLQLHVLYQVWLTDTLGTL